MLKYFLCTEAEVIIVTYRISARSSPCQTNLQNNQKFFSLLPENSWLVLIPAYEEGYKHEAEKNDDSLRVCLVIVQLNQVQSFRPVVRKLWCAYQ